MDGIRTRLGGSAGAATWLAAVLVGAIAVAVTVRGETPSRTIPPPLAAEPTDASQLPIPAAAHPQRDATPARTGRLRASYENLLDRGQELQDIVMRASVADLEDPNGEYQRRMREYGRLWSEYQREARRLNRGAAR